MAQLNGWWVSWLLLISFEAIINSGRLASDSIARKVYTEDHNNFRQRVGQSSHSIDITDRIALHLESQ